MKSIKYTALSWVMIFVFFHFCVFTVAPAVYAANDDLAAKLDKAEENYYNGDLDTALALVLECLRVSPLSESIKLRANKLLAHILLSKEERDAAKDAVFEILELEPAYQPTIEEEAPRYVALIEEVRRELSQRTALQKQSDGGISNWVWIGASGAAVAATVILLMSGGSSGSESKSAQLPLPPELPQN